MIRSGGVVLVTDLEEFVHHLQPSDVLVFDSLHPVSHMIQLSENRPINHAALYVGDGRGLQVTRPAPGGSAVQPFELVERLEHGYDRTVTALRHVDLDDGSLTAGRVLDAALEHTGASVAYDFVDLITLFVPALFRSYHDYLRTAARGTSGQPGLGRLGALLENVSNSLLDTFPAGTPGSLASRADSPHVASLTCSEFVYRCFEAARPGCLVLTEPLARWPGREHRDAAGWGEDDLADFGFHPGIEEQLGSQPAHRGDLFTATPTTGQQLARRAMRAIVQSALRNWDHNKYGDGIPPADAVLTDAVTPRDLWSSPSLRAAVVLHLAPGLLDSTIDTRH